jgi:hypothetical protein
VPALYRDVEAIGMMTDDDADRLSACVRMSMAHIKIAILVL